MSSVLIDSPPAAKSISRRTVFKTLLFGGAGLALYAGEVERHWIDIVHRDVYIPGLPDAFDGITIAQLSDIHLDEFTEPFLLREAVDEINRLHPDMVLLTGDYVSFQVLPQTDNGRRVALRPDAQQNRLSQKIRHPGQS